MAILRNYAFRNFFKQKLMQAQAIREYGSNHPYTALNKIARDTTVNFILENCPKAVAVRTPKQLMELALSKVSLDGVYMEFGVFEGESIRYIAKKNPQKEVHGFDSFHGLPEAWAHNPEGTFTTHGNLPKVPKNVTLWAGYFEKSLLEWKTKKQERPAFLHIDCDLYSSTETIFNYLKERITPGLVIVFDDYFNFPGWEQDGHAVLNNFLSKSNLSVEYIGYGFKELAVIIK